MKSALETFQVQVRVRRQEIMHRFDVVREAIDTSQREALAQFDACTQQSLKRLQTEWDAFAVKMQQACASPQENITVGSELSFEMGTVPVLGDAGLRILANLLKVKQCWSLSLDDNVSDRNQCQMLEEMQQFVKLARKEFNNDIFTKNMTKQSSVLFRGQFLKCIPVKDITEIGGFAASPDGTKFALSDCRRNHIECVSAFTGEVLWKTERKSKHYGLCFTSNGANILVTSLSAMYIEEIAVGHGHVRFLGMHNDNSNYRSVDASAQVVVACQFGLFGVTVFDYPTGNVLTVVTNQRYLHVPLPAYIGVKLTPDGTCVDATVQVGVNLACVDRFSLSGANELVQSVSLAATANDNVTQLQSGDLVVPGSGMTRVFTSDGKTEIHRLRSAVDSRLCKTCCINGFVCIFEMDKICVYW